MTDSNISFSSKVARQRNFFLSMSVFLLLCNGALSLKLFLSDERVILAPGLNQEVWSSNSGVSSGYIEEAVIMYLPLLLDLSSDSIEFKRDRLISFVSQSDPKYMKALTDYYSRLADRYKQFTWHTHFTAKEIITNPKELKAKVRGQLISRFGNDGFDTTSVTYGMSFKWVGGKLLLEEFVKLNEKED